MKVKINDTESYWIVWNYPKKEVVIDFGDYNLIEHHPNGESFCFIYDDSVQGEPKLVSSGVAICGVKDKFSRKTGRAITLGRALTKLFGEDVDKTRKFLDIYFSFSK